ncbi:MAG: hypothetical protein R3C56_13495 [Pirellulaceae bacterium]
MSGLNGRFSPQSQEMMQRIHDGAIGEITALHAVRNGDGVWVRPREPGMTEMEYQMRNWYYFTWLSGDFNVEMFIHQYDELAWAMQDEPRSHVTAPADVKCGRERCTVTSMTTSARFSSTPAGACLHYDSAFPRLRLRNRRVRDGNQGDGFPGSESPYHRRKCLAAASNARTGQPPVGARCFFHRTQRRTNHQQHRLHGQEYHDGHFARMSSYTGQTLTWEQGIQSQQDLSPSSYSWDGIPTEAVVAIPGVTKFS